MRFFFEHRSFTQAKTKCPDGMGMVRKGWGEEESQQMIDRTISLPMYSSKSDCLSLFLMRTWEIPCHVHPAYESKKSNVANVTQLLCTFFTEIKQLPSNKRHNFYFVKTFILFYVHSDSSHCSLTPLCKQQLCMATAPRVQVQRKLPLREGRKHS